MKVPVVLMVFTVLISISAECMSEIIRIDDPYGPVDLGFSFSEIRSVQIGVLNPPVAGYEDYRNIETGEIWRSNIHAHMGLTTDDDRYCWGWTAEYYDYQYEFGEISANEAIPYLIDGKATFGIHGVTYREPSPDVGWELIGAVLPEYGGGFYILIDGTPDIPEPASLLALAGGLTGLGILRMTRRKRQCQSKKAQDG